MILPDALVIAVCLEPTGREQVPRVQAGDDAVFKEARRRSAGAGLQNLPFACII
jgi:hypothetical protein